VAPTEVLSIFVVVGLLGKPLTLSVIVIRLLKVVPG